MSITENVRMARQKINAAAESADRSGSSGGGKVLIAVLIFVAFVLLKILFS